MTESAQRGTSKTEEREWWTAETAEDAEHRDEDSKSILGPKGDPYNPLVVPHARVPTGVWRCVIRLMDTEQRWLSEETFIVDAIREKVGREVAEAIRAKAEYYGVRGSLVRFADPLGDDTPRLI